MAVQQGYHECLSIRIKGRKEGKKNIGKTLPEPAVFSDEPLSVDVSEARNFQEVFANSLCLTPVKSKSEAKE